MSLSGSAEQSSSLTREQRGWYAVDFILDEGHDFLGQFITDGDGNVRWIQTERVLEGTNAFLASGIRNLESRLRTDQDIGAGDIGGAAVDAVIVGSAVKLLRMGRATAASTRYASFSARTTAYATRVGRAGQMAVRIGRYAKWPAAAAGVYLVVSHPGIITDVFAGIADLLGWPVWLTQFAGWILILLPVLWIISVLARLPCGRPLDCYRRWRECSSGPAIHPRDARSTLSYDGRPRDNPDPSTGTGSF